MLRKKMPLLVSGSVLLLVQITFAQPAASGTSNNQESMLAVEARGSEPQASQPEDTVLSRAFVANALKAAAQIRNWQSHLVYTLQNGYPLSDSWIASDRDQAADAVQLGSRSNHERYRSDGSAATGDSICECEELERRARRR